MTTLAHKITQAKRKQREKVQKSSETELKLQNHVTDNKDNKSIEPSNDRIEVSVDMANKLWNDIKKRVSEDPKFAELPDNGKIEIYQKSEFKDFYIEFPIVSRYIICMGQFSNKAFKKYLIKCKNANHDPVKSREKGYTEDQWVQRQADYIRYLWESYQKQHHSPSESNNIWQHAYNTLKKEFQDFKDLHDDVEKKLKEDEKTNKGELVKEMLSRIANQEQSLDENTTKKLIIKLQDQVIEQRKKILIKSIETNVNVIPPTRETRGSRKELTPSNEL